MEDDTDVKCCTNKTTQEIVYGILNIQNIPEMITTIDVACFSNKALQMARGDNLLGAHAPGAKISNGENGDCRNDEEW